MTMNTRRQERKENRSSPSASGRSSKPGRKRSVGTESEEMGLLTLSLPKNFIRDLKLVATARDIPYSAFVYEQCVGPVAESMDSMMKEYGERSQKYRPGKRS